MITIQKVLVATDFSPVAETALIYGRALARTFDAQLHLVHVVDDFSRFNYAEGAGLLPPSAFREEIARTGREKLESTLGEDDRRELRAVAVLREGHSTAKEIADYARETAIDIIVVGATGRGALDRMLMGSVADKVIRQAPCPVLTVRHPEHEFVVPDALQRASQASESGVLSR
jgi:nucleotide-binding universal stress UspA family protein